MTTLVHKFLFITLLLCIAGVFFLNSPEARGILGGAIATILSICGYSVANRR